MNQEPASKRTVVITGASSGAGWAMAAALAREGFRLVLAARRTDALDDIATECRSLGAAVYTVRTDTKHAADLAGLASAALEYTGSIDVWINNAGVLAAGTLEEIPAAVNEAVIQTNLIGYIHGAHAVLPIFKAQGYGILINNISIGAWLPTPYMTAYSASKFGLEGFTASLRGELRSYPSIQVCNLYPGFLDTPGMQHAANYTGKQLTPSPPLTDPREVANTVVRLIRNPKNTSTVGLFPQLMRLSYHLVPGLTRNATGGFLGTYLHYAQQAPVTSGNVLKPVDFGTGPDGGWRTSSMKPKPARGALVAGIAFGLLLAGLIKK